MRKLPEIPHPSIFSLRPGGNHLLIGILKEGQSFMARSTKGRGFSNFIIRIAISRDGDPFERQIEVQRFHKPRYDSKTMLNFLKQSISEYYEENTSM